MAISKINPGCCNSHDIAFAPIGSPCIPYYTSKVTIWIHETIATNIASLLAMVHAVLASKDTDTCLHLGGVWPALCKFHKT